MFFTDQELADAARHMKSDAVLIMRDIVSRVSAHNSALGEESRRYLTTFENRMPWAPPLGEAQQPRVIGPLDPKEEMFGGFVVLSSTQTGDAYAQWYPTLRDLVVPDFFDPRSLLAASILFHELFHAHDARTSDPAYQKPDANGRYPVETDAWNFQSQLLDAAVGGRFLQEVDRMAEAILSHGMRFVRHGSFHIPYLSPAFLRLFHEERPPDFCVNTLLLQTQYEIGKAMIRHTCQDESEQDHLLGTLHTRMTQQYSVPLSSGTKEFIRSFCMGW